jgi:hypothetical protein
MHEGTPRFLITPDSKVGEMLEHYPELEDVLIDMSPTYKALRNPVLRRTVAKVATLRQVSKVGNVPLGQLIDRLRDAVGQGAVGGQTDADDLPAERPDWADPAAVTETYDARPTIAAGGHPMPQVMQALAVLEPGQVYALVTPFLPAPLIDLAAGKGFTAWSAREGPEQVRTYFVLDRK